MSMHRHDGSVMHEPAFFRDFDTNHHLLGRTGDPLPAFWTTEDVSPAGSPTLDYGTAGGARSNYSLILSATAEIQLAAIHAAGNMRRLGFGGRAEAEFTAEISSWAPGGTYHADADVWVGLSYDAWVDHSGVWANMLYFAGFRVVGNNVIRCEYKDDGLTGAHSASSGVSFGGSGQVHRLGMSFHGHREDGSGGVLRWYIGRLFDTSSGHGGDWQQVGSHELSSDSMNLIAQPVLSVQRLAASAQADGLLIHRVRHWSTGY